MMSVSAFPSAAIFLAASRSSPVDPLPHQMYIIVGVVRRKTSFEFKDEAFNGTFYNLCISKRSKIVHFIQFFIT